MTDKTLWKRIQNDDGKAFEKAFDLYYKILCSYVLQFTNDLDSAEDIVQEAFVKLWVKRNSIEIKTSIKSYLFRITYNLFMDQYRKQKREDQLLNDLKFESINSILEEDTSISEEKIKIIKSLVNTLPEKCKQILLLSKEKGLKNKEIAVKLGLSIKTVESQMRIAFQKIRKGGAKKFY